MKFAFVKQDVYQDLYVAGPKASAEELLFSSLMRVGPIGLFTLAAADFLILKEEQDVPECRAWEKVIPNYRPEWLRQLKDRPHALTDLPEAGIYQHDATHTHADYSIRAAEVDWSIYDVVIGINFRYPAPSSKSTTMCSGAI